MSNWLVETINSLGEKLKESGKYFNILQSVMVLLLVMHRLDLHIQDKDNYFLNSLDYKHYKVLFQGLCVFPIGKSAVKSWPDFDSVKELFNYSKTKPDIAYVLTYMQRNALTFKQPVPEVLFSIPIFHFANGTWEPFKDATNLLGFDVVLMGHFKYFKDITTKW